MRNRSMERRPTLSFLSEQARLLPSCPRPARDDHQRNEQHARVTADNERPNDPPERERQHWHASQLAAVIVPANTNCKTHAAKILAVQALGFYAESIVDWNWRTLTSRGCK